MARAGFFAIILAVLQSANATPGRCRVDEMRRNDAIQFARTINNREAQAARDTGSYLPIASLAGLLESAPEDIARTFSVWLITDGKTYMFRLQDQVDACHASVFSANDGAIFTAASIESGR